MSLTLIHFAVGGLAVAASVYDWFYLRLPHVLTLSGALLALLGYGFVHEWGAEWGERMFGGLAGFVCLKGLQLYCRRRKGKECLGSGDSLLMLSLGSLTGVQGLSLTLPLAALSALATIFVLPRPLFSRSRKSRKIPLGPCLTFGSLLAVLIQPYVF